MQDMSHPSQDVITGAVRQGLSTQLQLFGQGNHGWLRGCEQTPQFIHDDGAGHQARLQAQLTRYLQRLQTSLLSQLQQLDKGAVAFGLLEQALFH